MLTIDNLNDNKVLEVSAKGKLTKDDYDIILPQLKGLLEKHGGLRFLIKLEDFKGFEKEALWKEIDFDRKHEDEYGKTAIVGDKAWEKWGTELSKLFFDVEMRYFPKTDEKLARTWVNN